MTIDENGAFLRIRAVASDDDRRKVEVLFVGLEAEGSGFNVCTQGCEFGDEEFGHLQLGQV